MPRNRPRLRGNRAARRAPHDLGEFGDSTIQALARQFIHRLATGFADITGDDFGGIFAKAIGGEQRSIPLGLSDVVWRNCGWTAKTVKNAKPHEAVGVRIISGRNSPDYSYGITNVRSDPQATGTAVLRIWNQRVDESMTEHDQLRTVILVRNFDLLEFTLFEDETNRFQPHDFRWSFNENNNLVAHRIESGELKFTWQPHGSQFTIHKSVPSSATRFSISQRPRLLEEQQVIDWAGFDPSWVVVEPPIV